MGYTLSIIALLVTAQPCHPVGSHQAMPFIPVIAAGYNKGLPATPYVAVAYFTVSPPEYPAAARPSFEAVCNVREIRNSSRPSTYPEWMCCQFSICPFNNARSVFAIRITKQRRQYFYSDKPIAQHLRRHFIWASSALACPCNKNNMRDTADLRLHAAARKGQSLYPEAVSPRIASSVRDRA